MNCNISHISVNRMNILLILCMGILFLSGSCRHRIKIPELGEKLSMERTSPGYADYIITGMGRWLNLYNVDIDGTSFNIAVDSNNIIRYIYGI